MLCPFFPGQCSYRAQPPKEVDLACTSASIYSTASICPLSFPNSSLPSLPSLFPSIIHLSIHLSIHPFIIYPLAFIHQYHPSTYPSVYDVHRSICCLLWADSLLSAGDRTIAKITMAMCLRVRWLREQPLVQKKYRIPTPALPLLSCVILGTLRAFHKPHFQLEIDE